MQDKVYIMGAPIDKLTFDETVRTLERRIQDEDRSKLFHLITANPEIVMRFKEDAALQKVVREASHITADGIGLVLASRWLRNPVPERVSGYDLMIRLLELGDSQGWSFYIFGADEETNRMTAQNISVRYPGVKLAGRHNGFFPREEESRIVEDIAAAKPDVLLVALGAPAAEFLINRNNSKLGAKVAIGIGGSFDVVAGKVKRAPLLWRKLYLEWLYRLLSQPSRWRRQLVLPKFAVRTLLGGRGGGRQS
jgi:N-acetylglucosaminyldiphosphoundecaprenol N-acetyl-beta-D-mannosaminyltransferase